LLWGVVGVIDALMIMLPTVVGQRSTTDHRQHRQKTAVAVAATVAETAAAAAATAAAVA